MLECRKCPAFLYSDESIVTGLCHGCRSTAPNDSYHLPRVSFSKDEKLNGVTWLALSLLGVAHEYREFARGHGD